jgi:predicted MPP superfamily phosphohydrolase
MSRIRALVSPSQAPRIALVVSVWVGLHLYAGRPLVAAAQAHGVAAGVAWAGLVAISLVSMLPLLVAGGSFRLRSAAHWLGYASMSLFAMLLVLVALSDLVRVSLFLTTRVLLDPRILSTPILGAAVVLATIGLAQARHPRVVRRRIEIDGLPSELDGYRIVQWSDVHIGPTIQRCFVDSLVARTNALDADAIAITGDLVDGNLDDLREQVQPLADLRTRDGVFFITGNHEYYWRAEAWVAELSRLGLTFLKNEHRVIGRGAARLVMAGVTDPAGRGTHAPDADGALAGAPRDATRVLLSHRPQVAAASSRLGVHLQLSGHTHGGQFFPFNLLIKHFQPLVAGLHRVGATQVYISRGTGYWGPPSRLGVGGEITVLELRRSA